MNKKLIAVSIIVGFLMSVMPAYASAVLVPPPYPSWYARSGATYTAYYQCGLDDLGVWHRFYLRIHNNQRTTQYFYVKILDESGLYLPPSLWVFYAPGAPNNYYRWPIDSDALYALDCDFILFSLGGGDYGRGVIVLSHPGATTDLDVIATEISSALNVAYNEQTIYVPGVRVSNIPTPCVIPTGQTRCQTLPP